MNEEDPELIEQLNSVTPPTTGTVDDDDEPEDERPDENEAPAGNAIGQISSEPYRPD